VATLFAGVCALDGHSQASMDGIKATRERGGCDPVVFFAWILVVIRLQDGLFTQTLRNAQNFILEGKRRLRYYLIP